MDRRISRRSALRVLGGAAAAASGLLVGVFPETQLARAGASVEIEAIARGRQPVLRRHTGITTDRRAIFAQARPQGAIARRFLASQGFRGQYIATESADVLWSDGELIGTIDAVLFHDDKRNAYAHLIRQTSGAREIVGVSIFTAARPETRDVYDVREGQVVLSATVSREADGTVLVRGADGRTDVIRPRTSGGKVPGLAAPASAIYCEPICRWECTFVCTWVCTQVLMVTCAITAVCGPLTPLCAGACIVAVIASCGWNCNNVCGLSCGYWCHVLEEAVP